MLFKVYILTTTFCFVDYDYERPRIHKRIPSGDFISTTNSQGERFYVKLKDETTLSKEVDFIFVVVEIICFIFFYFLKTDMLNMCV